MSDTPTPRLEPSALMPHVYDELRALAANYLRRERPDHTLQPTALVHEAYLKLMQRATLDIRNRTHFFALASGAMRQILVDHARAHRALKRGGGWQRIAVDESLGVRDGRFEDVLELDEALTKLAERDARAARIVELRFFGGLTEPEVAQEMEMSERWVRKQWAFARAWLRREMSPS